MNRESTIMLVYLSLIFKAKKLCGSQLTSNNKRYTNYTKKRNEIIKIYVNSNFFKHKNIKYVQILKKINN